MFVENSNMQNANTISRKHTYQRKYQNQNGFFFLLSSKSPQLFKQLSDLHSILPSNQTADNIIHATEEKSKPKIIREKGRRKSSWRCHSSAFLQLHKEFRNNNE